VDKTTQIERQINIYKSEVKQYANGYSFNPVTIHSSILCNGNFSNSIIIEFYDFKKQRMISAKTSTIEKFISSDNIFTLFDLNIRLNTTITKEYHFIDYLKGGMQLALSIGIDFTGSNGDPRDETSLHNITKGQPTQYERAIRSCGEIVAYYDYDQLFPVYGYGAILPGNKDVSHCFNINYTNDPNINTINNVIQTYKGILPNIHLSGPTFFAPLINQMINSIKYSSNTSQVYHILLILTDGIINDMEDTIDAVVEASFLPMSIIIVGIGMNDFSNMDILDADDNPLYDRRRRKARRDIVQFVPFYKFQNDSQKLSEEVLEEIPYQVVEHYKIVGMPPGDPLK